MLYKQNEAPRITPEILEQHIDYEIYTYVDVGNKKVELDMLTKFGYDPTKLITICILVLKNGFTVVAESACASPENFNVEAGRKAARKRALDKLWPLLGYSLRDTLHNNLTAVSGVLYPSKAK